MRRGIAQRLRADPMLAETSELRPELPYEFHRGEDGQILRDAVEVVAAALGCMPAPMHLGK